MIALIVLIAAALVAAKENEAALFDVTFAELPSGEASLAAAFEHLVRKHGRVYASDDERASKYATFKSNVERMAELRRREPKARFSPNLFFDLSAAEFAKYRMKPKNIVDEAKKVHTVKTRAGGVTVVPACLANGVEKKKRAAPAARPNALPAQFDWGTHNPPVITPVKNQGACGSCWSFSATETLESAWAIKYGKLNVLAPQQIVDCSTTCSNEGNPPMPVCDQGCDGGWPWGAIATLIQEGGQDSEASYPYQGVDGQCAFNKANVLAVPKNYTCISGPDVATEDEVKAALIKYGPLSVAADATEWQFYEFGIISQNFLCSQTELDHAIQITAYVTVDDVFGYPTNVWKIRNSWASSFGLSGYLYLTRGENTCGIESAVMAVNV